MLEQVAQRRIGEQIVRTRAAGPQSAQERVRGVRVHQAGPVHRHGHRELIIEHYGPRPGDQAPVGERHRQRTEFLGGPGVDDERLQRGVEPPPPPWFTVQSARQLGHRGRAEPMDVEDRQLVLTGPAGQLRDHQRTGDLGEDRDQFRCEVGKYARAGRGAARRVGVGGFVDGLIRRERVAVGGEFIRCEVGFVTAGRFGFGGGEEGRQIREVVRGRRTAR